jgi:diguanylate cyclase
MTEYLTMVPILLLYKYKSSQLIRILFCFYAFLFPNFSNAQEQFVGQWYEVGTHWHYPEAPIKKVLMPSLTGGHFVFQSTLQVSKPDEPVIIDFKNASVLGQFHHYISDMQGNLVAEAQGGIQSHVENPFFMRHGREFKLAPGKYRLTTELASPYFIAEPQPYWDQLSNYRQAIKWGTVIALVCLGVLMSLGVYYAILAYVRRRVTETMYTSFILLNVVSTSMSMLIAPDLLNIHWFYLAGGPFLFSNVAYVLFAKSLLQIRQETHPRLNNIAQGVLVLLGVLLVVALIQPHWLLECARYGVALMMVYGLVAAITRAYQGYKIANFYLVAIVAFFVIGSIALSSNDLVGIYTIYVEHIGLIAVTVEVLLIGLVLGYQFAEVYREKESNLVLLRQSLQIAHYDALTGLPNRYALDEALRVLTAKGMLTFIDMDNLKLYNDQYGHQKGDEMLQVFAKAMAESLGEHGVLHRMGGDEFAVTSESINFSVIIERAVSSTVDVMHQQGFEKAGLSFGTAYMLETHDISELKHLADERMYRHKRSKRTGSLFNSTH